MVKQKQGVWINYRWWLFRAWGRVGTTIGGNKVERYGSVDTLLEGFKQLYAEKTGNEWHDRKSFKKYPNKFYPLDIDYGQVSLRKEEYINIIVCEIIYCYLKELCVYFLLEEI